MNIELIKENALLTVKQCEIVRNLYSELSNIKASPYYSTFSNEAERGRDIDAKLREIHIQETVLRGMMK